MTMAIRVAKTGINSRFIIAVLIRFFLSCFFSLASLDTTFLFVDGFFINYFLKSFTLSLNLLMKNLLIIMTYLN